MDWERSHCGMRVKIVTHPGAIESWNGGNGRIYPNPWGEIALIKQNLPEAKGQHRHSTDQGQLTWKRVEGIGGHNL